MAIPGRIPFGCCLAAVTAFLNPGAVDRALADVGGSASGRTAVSEVHHVPLFPPASDGMRQGFVRVINRTGQAGEVLIHAVDDAGARRGPVTLELAGGQTAHFNSEDLEGGNAGKGLTGQVGPGSGTWRLELESGLDVEVLSYVRTEDGFLTAMHDVAPQSADGFVVATFNPAANRNQRSSLRLVNPNSLAASVTIVGVDDEGSSPGSNVSLSIPPGAARILTAPQFEAGGADLSGALGDGDTDLLDDPRGGDPQPVAWWENAGGGSFPERRVVSSNRVHAVEAADLDGDGDTDLLSAAAYDRELSWYENLGSGAFSAPKAIATDPGAVWSVRTSDLDGDGDPDVIAPSDVDERDGEVRWYENRGGGSFGPARRVAESTYQTRDLFAADLDGDGDADLIGAYSGYGTKDYYQAEWFENVGRGEFSDRRIVRIEDRDNSALRPVDLDGDGAVDLLAVGLSDGEVAWYRNLGGGRFSGQRVIVEHGRYGGFDTADLDGDGDTDLVYNARLRDTIAWHENLGGGVFSGERLIADDFDGDWSIVAADLDSSGEPDVLARYWNRGQLVWFRNQGTSRAPTEAPANMRVVAGVGLLWVSWEPLAGLGDSERAQARYIVTALAADGSVAGECIATELIGCSITGLTPGEEYEVTVQAENEAGAGPVSAAVSVTAAVDTEPPGTRFGPQKVITTQALEPKSVRAADLDDDTDLDALSASSEDDTIAWHENTATGFLPVRHVITASADGAGHVRTGDLDDGDSDVVSASFDDQIVAWYENLGAGAFAAQSVIAMDASNLGSLDLADLDDDGDLDVLIAGPGEYGLEWYENLGGAVFAGSRNVAESNYNSGAIASPADLDADGDLDVLTTTSFNNGIGWHENLGSGSFSPARTITTGLESTATLSTADVDGDGDPDILHGSHREDTVAWYENRGGGDFHGRRVIATGIDDISAVTPGDLDADGDVDIIIASYDDDRIAWYENLERGRFSGARVVTMDADGAIDAIAADLDGDGDADILAAASIGNTIAWHENLGPSN